MRQYSEKSPETGERWSPGGQGQVAPLFSVKKSWQFDQLGFAAGRAFEAEAPSPRPSSRSFSMTMAA